MPPRAGLTLDRLRKNAPSPLGGPIFFLTMQGIEAPMRPPSAGSHNALCPQGTVDLWLLGGVGVIPAKAGIWMPNLTGRAKRTSRPSPLTLDGGIANRQIGVEWIGKANLAPSSRMSRGPALPYRRVGIAVPKLLDDGSLVGFPRPRCRQSVGAKYPRHDRVVVALPVIVDGVPNTFLLVQLDLDLALFSRPAEANVSHGDTSGDGH